MSSSGTDAPRSRPLEIFLIFLKLGLTSFGGPIAHLGYFRREFVSRRRWLSEHAFSDLVSLCQFLPGPASSQIGMALGLSRGGFLGAVAAFLGFTLPSAILLVLCALGIAAWGNGPGFQLVTHGLKIVAVAIVAQALWSMSGLLGRNPLRIGLAAVSAAVFLFLHAAWCQILLILAGGIVGALAMKDPMKDPLKDQDGAPGISSVPHVPPRVARESRGAAMVSLSLFFLLLVGLPLLAASGIAGFQAYGFRLFDAFYRAGALVFGGGHVVLPLLQSQVVPQWVSSSDFMAGYGFAQAVPGPLFSFAAFLGAVSSGSPHGWLGAAIATLAIFLPAFLLITGVLPFWEPLRRHPVMQRALRGINAVVVGLLLAAFYHPVVTSAIQGWSDVVVAGVALALLIRVKFPSWAVVVITVVLTVLVRWIPG